MSYAVNDKATANRSSYSKIASGDDEAQSNPLTSGQGKKMKQKIET